MRSTSLAACDFLLWNSIRILDQPEVFVYSLLIRYGHMIDNVVLIVTGTLHERDVQELLEKCHPLGMFDRYYLLFDLWRDI